MTEPPVWVPSAAGTMPAATAAAEPEEEPPGVCSRLRGLRVTDGGQRRQLGGDGLADDDGARPAQRGDAGGVAGRPASLEDGAAVLGRHVGGVDDVLDADGDAMQRADALACPARRVGRLRLLERALAVEERPGADLRLERIDAGEAGANQLLATVMLPRGDARGGLGGGEVGECERAANGAGPRSVRTGQRPSPFSPWISVSTKS